MDENEIFLHAFLPNISCSDKYLTSNIYKYKVGLHSLSLLLNLFFKSNPVLQAQSRTI